MTTWERLGGCLTTLLLTACGGGAGDSPAEPPVYPPSRVLFLARSVLASTPGPEGYRLMLGTSAGDHPLDLSGPMPVDHWVRWYAWSPDRTLVAFIADSEVKGRNELFVVSTLGGPPWKVSFLSHPDADVTSASWHPTRNLLLYRADADQDERFDLYFRDPVAVAPLLVSLGRFSPGGSVLQFAWHPYGRRFAYLVAESGSFAPGSTWEALEDDPLLVQALAYGTAEFSFRPDDRLPPVIALRRPNRLTIGYLDPGTAGLSSTDDVSASLGVEGPEVEFREFQWAPVPGLPTFALTYFDTRTGLEYLLRDDGRPVTMDDQHLARWTYEPLGGYTIAYGHSPAGQSGLKLYLHSVTGDGVSEVTSGSWYLDYDISHAWSPAGRSLAYARYNQDSPSDHVLCTCLRDGALERVLATSQRPFGAGSIQWSPDGALVAFLTRPEPDAPDFLYTARPDGTYTVPANPPLPPGGGVSMFSWSSDGRRLFYTARQDSSDHVELYCVPPERRFEAVKVSGPPDQTATEVIPYFVPD